MATPRKKTTETAPVKPEDHKASLPEQTEGWDLLISPKRVKASDRFRLMGKLKAMRVDSVNEGDSYEPDFDLFADLIDLVGERIAKDEDAFVEWSMGADGPERVMNLVMAYTEALGE